MKEQPSHARYLRWLYELLLSIYFVLMFVGTDSFGNFCRARGEAPESRG